MKSILTFCLAIISLLSIAQVSYEARVEIDLSSEYNHDDLLLFGEEGLIMTSQSDHSNNGMVEWKYEKFSNSLDRISSKSIHLGRKLYSDETYTNDKRTHTFYKDRRGNFSLVSIEATTLKITKVDGKLPTKSWMKDMVVLGDYAIFNASIRKKPVLFKVNWKTGATKITPIEIAGVSTSKIGIENFQILEKSKEVLIFVKVYLPKKELNMYLLRLDEKGVKKNTINLSKYIDKNITSISASRTNSGKYVYTGTYSSASTHSSEGIFFAESGAGSLKFVKFYNFLDLDEFLSYLPEKKQEKIEKKQKKKAKKGKEYSINFSIADHNIIEKEDGYIFLGEAYYPTYRTESYTTTTTVNGVTTTQTRYRTVFDGYQYTHSVIAKFSKEGELVWDKTFEMWQAYKPYYVKRFISIAEENQSNISLVFASGGSIISKSFDTKTGAIEKDERSKPIETGLSEDQVKRSFSNIDYWYGNYFLAYGNQKIKNSKDASVKRKRKVFFFSKVKY